MDLSGEPGEWRVVTVHEMPGIPNLVAVNLKRETTVDDTVVTESMAIAWHADTAPKVHETFSIQLAITGYR